MKSMVAIEKMIKDFEFRITIARQQLSLHNSGEKKLTRLTLSSTENSLEKHGFLLEKYRKIMKEFEKFEKLDSYEHRRLKAAIERKKYYKFNKESEGFQNQRVRYRENDERIEAAMIIDELPNETLLNDQELFHIASEPIQLFIPLNSDAKKDLGDIQNEFNLLIKNFTDENIKSLELLNYMIPIVIFHFKTFKMFAHEVQEVEKSQNEELKQSDTKEEEFTFPKYHDWWITELWTSHIAYFSIFKWKKSISSLCKTKELKQAWELLFNNWIFVKTLLSEKSNPAFEYQYIFDTLLHKYVDFQSELDVKIVSLAEKEMERFINNENLLSLIPEHNVVTSYITFKKTLL